MIYSLTDANGEVLKCKYLVVAAGWTKENIPKFIEGVEGVLTYGGHPIDRERYKAKKVLIIGKGNSALETADHLIPVASKIHLISP
jgi:thioredoxin reductase